MAPKRAAAKRGVEVQTPPPRASKKGKTDAAEQKKPSSAAVATATPKLAKVKDEPTDVKDTFDMSSSHPEQASVVEAVEQSLTDFLESDAALPAVDPEAVEMCATVAAALGGASDLPENARETLKNFAFGSLLTFAEDRHPCQDLAVQTVGSALAEMEAVRARSLEAAEARMKVTEEKKAACQHATAGAMAAVTSQQSEVDGLRTTFSEAQASASAAARRLEEAIAAKSSYEAEAASLPEEKAHCEGAAAFEFKLVCDGITVFQNGAFLKPWDPKHISKLEAIFRKMQVDEGMVQALATVAAKTPGARSKFDIGVLEELQKRLTAHIYTLDSKIAVSGPTLRERAAAVDAGRSVSSAEEIRRQQAEAALEAAISSRTAAESTLADAQQALRESSVALVRIEAECAELRHHLMDFRKGPLAAFESLRERRELELVEQAAESPSEVQGAPGTPTGAEAAESPSEVDGAPGTPKGAEVPKRMSMGGPCMPLPTPCRVSTGGI
eukprot:gnl/TRDRNA2_/TRDRNA2_190457_c0_seq1.p1 gnl/TRDRNA2_/TRDRNA2_190457_c0~~gnl/TRDRNA2_/TRDRNA2_190457_c0_seq1.p1  ORF type:complete len:499 (+),score=136.41 gnl/TRDRNA2_/TRDRNA2_190457_c0_seq1:120-1616(+)